MMSHYIKSVTLQNPSPDAHTYLTDIGVKQTYAQGKRTLYIEGNSIELQEDAIGSAHSLIDLGLVCFIKKHNLSMELTSKYNPDTRHSLYEQERSRLAASGIDVPDYNEYKSTSLQSEKTVELEVSRNSEDEFDYSGVQEGVRYELRPINDKYMAADATQLIQVMNKMKCQFVIPVPSPAWSVEKNAYHLRLLDAGYESLQSGACVIGPRVQTSANHFALGPEHPDEVEKIVKFLDDVCPGGYKFKHMPVVKQERSSVGLDTPIADYSSAPSGQAAAGALESMFKVVEEALNTGGGKKLATITGDIKRSAPLFDKENNPFRSKSSGKLLPALIRGIREIKEDQRGKTVRELVDLMAEQCAITYANVGEQKTKACQDIGRNVELMQLTADEYRLFALDIIISSPAEFVPDGMERNGEEFVLPEHSQLALHGTTNRRSRIVKIDTSVFKNKHTKKGPYNHGASWGEAQNYQ